MNSAFFTQRWKQCAACDMNWSSQITMTITMLLNGLGQNGKETSSLSQRWGRSWLRIALCPFMVCHSDWEGVQWLSLSLPTFSGVSFFCFCTASLRRRWIQIVTCIEQNLWIFLFAIWKLVLHFSTYKHGTFSSFFFISYRTYRGGWNSTGIILPSDFSWRHPIRNSTWQLDMACDVSGEGKSCCRYHMSVSERTVRRALKNMGWSRKRVSRVPEVRNT